MKRIYPLLSIVCTLAAASPAASQGSGFVRDFRQATENTAALALSNPALLDVIDGYRGLITANAQKENGGLISLSESPNSYKTNADAEAFCRISTKLVFHGKMGWHYFYGKDMGGQILMNPSYNPVNFLERTEDTKGNKNRERYFLDGGLSCKLGQRWTAGIKLEYEAANQTKIKDPRFSNVWMDINLRAGVTFKPGDLWLFGASLQYRNTLEQVKGGVFGTTDKQYFVATDKGAFLGTVSALEGDYNEISTDNFRLIPNQMFGAAIQAVAGNLFAGEVWFLLRDGYFGRRSSATPVFYEFNGIQGGYNARLLIPSANSLHRFNWTLDFESLSNQENKFRYVTPTGMNTSVEYLGKDIVLRRIQASAHMNYTWDKGTDSFLPSLSLGARLDAGFNNQKVSIFPTTRKQQVVSLKADLYGRKNLPAGKSYFSIELHVLAGGGFGTPCKDETDPSATSSSLKSYDGYLYQQYEFETAFRMGGQAAFTWTLLSLEKMIPYVKLSDSFTTLLSAPKYLEGAGRNVAAVCIGCNF